MWRVAQMSVLDVASGTVTKIHDQLPQPGTPTWSPDGKAARARRHRADDEALPRGHEPDTDDRPAGTRRPRQGAPRPDGDDVWFAPEPLLSIDSRGGCGPAWSPDGTKMAAIYEGVLSVWPVAATGEPLGPPRRVTQRERARAELAGRLASHPVSVARQAAHRRHRDRRDARPVPLDLKCTPAVPTTRAGRPRRQARRHEDADGATERRRRDRRQPDHERRAARGRQSRAGERQVIDASNLTRDAGPGRSSTRICSRTSASRRAARCSPSASRRCGVLATRRTKRSKSARRTRPACVRARASTAPAI